ncbi:MAG: hypothetical protein F6K19_13800 [Cyanothece sp. SIO1E1]|nr:hypothetical protein [Cyanothece sp. SIO1E1]
MHNTLSALIEAPQTSHSVELSDLPGMMVEWHSINLAGKAKKSPIIMYDFGEEWARAMKSHILEVEPEIRQLGPDVYPATAKDSLTGRWRYYNVFDYGWAELEYAKPIIHKLVDAFVALGQLTPAQNYHFQSWCNTFRQGEYIGWHCHCPESEYEYPCANIYHGGAHNTQTLYKFAHGHVKGFENIPGRLTLFSNTLPHHVPPYQGDDARVTQALDFFPQDSHIVSLAESHQWRVL